MALLSQLHKQKWFLGRPNQQAALLWTIPLIVAPPVFILVCPAINMVGTLKSYGEPRILGAMLVFVAVAGLWQLVHMPSGFLAAASALGMTAVVSLVVIATGPSRLWALGSLLLVAALLVTQWRVYRVTLSLWPRCQECELVRGRWDITDAVDPLWIGKEPVTVLPVPPEAVASPPNRIRRQQWVVDNRPGLEAGGLVLLCVVLSLLVIPICGMPVKTFSDVAAGRRLVPEAEADWSDDDRAYAKALAAAEATAHAGIRAAAWQAYLDANSGGRHELEATERLSAAEERWWHECQAAVATATSSEEKLRACERYGTTFRGGVYASKLEDRMKHLVEELAAGTSGVLAKLRGFAAYTHVFPEAQLPSELAPRTWQRLAEADTQLSLSDRVAAYGTYYNVFPDGPHRTEAHEAAWTATRELADAADKLSDKLEAYRTYAQVLTTHAQQADARAWAAVCEAADRAEHPDGKIGPHEAYLAAFNTGSYRQEAEKVIRSVRDKLEAEIKRQQQQCHIALERARKALAAKDFDSAKQEVLAALRHRPADGTARDLLRKVAAVLLITSQPDGAEVSIDGEAVGATPLLHEQVEIGRTYTITASKPHWHARPKLITVNGFGDIAVLLHMQKYQPPRWPAGLPQSFMQPSEKVDQYENPAVTRQEATHDPITGYPYEVWLREPRMEFVLVPAGEFMMVWEGTWAHKVQLTRPFYLAKYEVTQAQWYAVAGNRPWSRTRYVKANGRSPAVCISWEDCQGFLKKLGHGLRLPTEAEWEYACRAGSTGKFCFGDDDSKLKDYAWYVDTARSAGECYPHGVGQKRPNAWGLYDMHGNVCEWCHDWHGAHPNKTQTDPRGPEHGSSRVIRGGYFDDGHGPCRSASRSWRPPGSRFYANGFRLSISLP